MLLASAFQARAKVCKNILWEAPSNIHQELMMISIIIPNAVEASQTKEAMKTARQDVRVVARPSPKAVVPKS